MSLYDEKSLQAFLKKILFLYFGAISITIDAAVIITDCSPDAAD